MFVHSDEFKDSFDITLIDLNTLKPKVVHIQGLEKGGMVEAYSDVDPSENATTAVSENIE